MFLIYYLIFINISWYFIWIGNPKPHLRRPAGFFVCLDMLLFEKVCFGQKLRICNNMCQYIMYTWYINTLIQIDFNAKSTSTSRSEKCVDSNRSQWQIDFY